MSRQVPSVAEYVIERLRNLGIDCAFGVPGDYAFPFDDAIESTEGVEWILNANELNASYAADGYARQRGAAILTTTFGVGELSAVNGVMGAYAHRVPIFHLVGMPSTRISKSKLITHHSLGSSIDYAVPDVFYQMSKAACCADTLLTPANVVMEMERLIQIAFELSKPVYVRCPTDYAKMPVICSDYEKYLSIMGRPQLESSKIELDAALTAILNKLSNAKSIVAMPTILVPRYEAVDEVSNLLEKHKIPFVTFPMDKGVLPETHPMFNGMYSGKTTVRKETIQLVESADVILSFGDLIMEDLSTGFWSSNIKEEQVITIGDRYVKVDENVFSLVGLKDVVVALSEKLSLNLPSSQRIPSTIPSLEADPSSNISSAAFFARLERNFIRPTDAVVAETGSCMIHLKTLNLASNNRYEAQTLWGSIGWATPAALGVALADKSRRTVLVTGDGSHQLTANDIGVMGRYNANVVIFVLNNGIFGIEDVLSEMGHVYDDLAKWNYSKLPEAMGCTGWLSMKVQTVSELDRAMEAIQSSNKPAYVEVMIPAAESQPVSDDLKNHIYKTFVPNVK